MTVGTEKQRLDPIRVLRFCTKIAGAGVLLVAVALIQTSSAGNWDDLIVRADSLARARQFDSAITLAESALLIPIDSANSSDTAHPAINYKIGRYYFSKGAYQLSAEHLKKSVEAFESAQGVDNISAATPSYYLAAAHMQLGELDHAERYFQKALDIRRTVFGDNHIEVARSLIGYSSLKNRLQDFDAVEEFAHKALDILTVVLPPNDAEVAKPMVILADLHLNLGRYSDAAELYERALEIRRASMGEKNPEVARTIGRLASAYYLMGDYPESEHLYSQSLEISRALYGEVDYRVATDMSNLALTASALGKLDEAEEQYREALGILESTLGANHPRVAQCLGLLAHTLLSKREYAEASTVYERALAITKTTNGESHSSVAVILNNLGGVHLGLDEFAKAEAEYGQALTIIENSLGADHPMSCGSLNGLAISASLQGKLEDARTFLEGSIQLERKVLGQYHPELARSLELLCNVERLRDNQDAALSAALEAVKIRRQNVDIGAEVMSARDALLYSQRAKRSAALYLSVLTDNSDVMANRPNDGLEIIAQIKGIVTEAALRHQPSKVPGTDSATLKLFEEYRRAKYDLARLFLESLGDLSADSGQARLVELQEEVNGLEQSLARASRDFRQKRTRAELSVAKIVDALPLRSVLVEFYKFSQMDSQGAESGTRYIVAVLGPDRVNSLIDLGNGNPIDEAVDQYRHHMLELANSGRQPSADDLTRYTELAGRLSSLVIEPLEQFLPYEGLVFISPDGPLNLVSFAGLPLLSGEYVGEAFQLHYLNSGRDIANVDSEGASSEGLFAIGDPDFDFRSDIVDPSLRTQSVNDRKESDYGGCSPLSNIPLPRLPGTRREISGIAAVWHSGGGGPVDTLLSTSATETNFKQNAAGHRVIHLATHGFFSPASCFSNDAEGNTMIESELVTRNPLLLSGLFLAGANRSASTGTSLDDGVLTAEEVSAIDLHGTQWVVLSACESGLGETRAGEGVFGLRRAFQIAGAETVLSTLWPIPDAYTARMMKSFYVRIDLSVPETVQQIIIDRLKDLRRRGQPEHPFLWSSFVAVGDWRQLDR